MGRLNLVCIETGTIVHVVEEASLDEHTVKRFEQFYSAYYGRHLFAEIA
jgi:hypothetical protein